MPEMADLFYMFYLCIGNRCLADRTPVDDSGTFVNIAFLMQLAENFFYSLGTAFIHCKTLSVPVSGRTQFLQLFDNTAAIFFLPFPCFLKETFTSEFFFADAFFFHLIDDLDLSCNAGMVCTRLP